MRLAGFILMGGVVWIILSKILRSAGFESAIRQIYALVRKIKLPPRQIQIGAAFGLVLIVPLFLNNYSLDILTLAGIYIVLALGLNIVVGMAGLLDLGY